MKRISFLLLIIFLSATIVKWQTTKGKLPNVTKGYYAIGNNHKKLDTDTVPASTDIIIVPQISKGYYSIKDKNKQIAIKPANSSRTVSKPIVTKGYYSIGNNAEKLIKQR